MEKSAKAKEERNSFVIFSFFSDSLQVWTLTLVKLVVICCREKLALCLSLNGHIFGFFCGLKQEKMEYFNFLCFLQWWLVLFREWIEHIFSLSLWDNHCLNPQLDSFWSDEMLILQIHIIEFILTTRYLTGISIYLLQWHAGCNAVFSHFGSVFWLFGVKTDVPEERAAAPPDPDSEAGRGYPVRGSACKNWCHHIHRSPHAPKDQAPVHPEGHNHSLQWSLCVSSAADTHRACELLHSQEWLHPSPLFEVKVNRGYDLAATVLYLGETQLYWTRRIYPGVCAEGSSE